MKESVVLVETKRGRVGFEVRLRLAMESCSQRPHMILR